MSYTVNCYNKNTNSTYVYRCENYKDPDTGKWKSRRQCIGKLDEDGNVVKTGKRGRRPISSESDSNPSYQGIPNLEQLESTLRSELRKEIHNEYRDQMFKLQTQITELERKLSREKTAFNNIIRDMTHIIETAQAKASQTKV